MTRPGPHPTGLVQHLADGGSERSSTDERYPDALANQKAINQLIWLQLGELGVTPATELELDFTFIAPSAEAARALEEQLARLTDYTLSIRRGAGPTSTLTGTTRPAAVNLAILDEWADWMICLGLSQDCEFAGWGTEAP